MTKFKGYQGQRLPRSKVTTVTKVKFRRGQRGQRSQRSKPRSKRLQRSKVKFKVKCCGFSSSRSQSRSRVKLRGQFERKLLKIVENCVKMPVEGYWSWFEIWKCLRGCHNAYFSENCRNCQKFFRNYARFA